MVCYENSIMMFLVRGKQTKRNSLPTSETQNAAKARSPAK